MSGSKHKKQASLAAGRGGGLPDWLLGYSGDFATVRAHMDELRKLLAPAAAARYDDDYLFHLGHRLDNEVRRFESASWTAPQRKQYASLMQLPAAKLALAAYEARLPAQALQAWRESWRDQLYADAPEDDAITDAGACSTQIVRMPQFTGTCWFNALLMALLHSQGMRRVLRGHYSDWRAARDDGFGGVREAFWQIMRHSYRMNSSPFAYKALFHLTPESLLRAMHEAEDRTADARAPRLFPFNPAATEGLQPEKYTVPLLHLLKVQRSTLLHAVSRADGTFDVYDCLDDEELDGARGRLQKHIQDDTEVLAISLQPSSAGHAARAEDRRRSLESEAAQWRAYGDDLRGARGYWTELREWYGQYGAAWPRAQDVKDLLECGNAWLHGLDAVRDAELAMRRALPIATGVPLHRTAGARVHLPRWEDGRGVAFRIDSMFIYDDRQLHVIAGLTCANRRFLYNGWLASTSDPAAAAAGRPTSTNAQSRPQAQAHAADGGIDAPCPLYDVDWLDPQTVLRLCGEGSMCRLDAQVSGSRRKKGDDGLCFKLSADRRITYFAVRDGARAQSQAQSQPQTRHGDRQERLRAEEYSVWSALVREAPDTADALKDAVRTCIATLDAAAAAQPGKAPRGYPPDVRAQLGALAVQADQRLARWTAVQLGLTGGGARRARAKAKAKR